MSEASLSIYRRPEGYYLVVSAQTTAGIWQHCAEPPDLLGATAEAVDIGDLALRRLAKPRSPIPHPQRDQWTDVRRASLTPIMRSAKLRSWKAFTATATLVDVHRTDLDFTVTPMAPPAGPQEGFEPDVDRERMLQEPTADSLGTAIVQAFFPE